MDGQQGRRARAFLVQLADAVPWRLRGNHRDVDVFREIERAKPDVESVREHQRLASREIGANRLAIERRLDGVGHEHHDDVSPGARSGWLVDSDAVGLRLRARFASRMKPDAHIHAAVAQVQCVRMPLRSITKDRDLASAYEREVSVSVVINLGHKNLRKGDRDQL